MADYLDEDVIVQDDNSYFGVSISQDELKEYYSEINKLFRNSEDSIGLEIKNLRENLEKPPINEGNIMMIRTNSFPPGQYKQALYRVIKIEEDGLYADVFLEPVPENKPDIRLVFSHGSFNVCFFGANLERKIRNHEERFKESAEESEVTITGLKILPDGPIGKIVGIDSKYLVNHKI